MKTLADWPSFKALCETEVNNTILQADDPIDRFTTTLHQIAIKTVPRTSFNALIIPILSLQSLFNIPVP